MPPITQLELLTLAPPPQLLKWVGNKQRYAAQIVRVFPGNYRHYFEPFLGSGAVLGAVSPKKGIVGDTLRPLIELWQLVQKEPLKLLAYYKRTWQVFVRARDATYLKVRNAYNSNPNPYDLLFLSRSCYGGVVRFTKSGTMSTPIGIHMPIAPETFEHRLCLWGDRIENTRFAFSDFEETMSQAGNGDVVYCDPPYVHCQSILYGAQAFDLQRLWQSIERCVSKGAKVILSIDGSKKSGKLNLDIDIPIELFKRQIMINCGRSMLRRFQRSGETLEDEVVQDRLLLTW